MRKRSHIVSGQRPVSSERPRFEALEQRRLFSGNVVVAMNPVTFAIDVTGGNQVDAIQITGGPQFGYTVQGLAGTTVNGQASVSRLRGGPINVTLGNGNDTVLLGADQDFDGSAAIQVGNGNNVIAAQGINRSGAGAALSITTGNGNNAVTVTSSFSSSNSQLAIQTGSGNDNVTVSSCFCGNVAINTGAGNDQVNVGIMPGLANLSIDTGSGDDQVVVSDIFSNVVLNVQTGNGDDTLFLDKVFFDPSSSTFDGGRGNNALTVRRLFNGPSVTNAQGFQTVTVIVIPFDPNA